MRYLFGPFVLDSGDETLVRDGARVALRGKAFAVLCVLAEHRGALVTRERLLERVWGEAVVVEQSLSVCIKEIRAALRDDARAPRYVQTEHRRGYRMIAAVSATGEELARDTVTHDERVGAGTARWLAFVWTAGQPCAHDVPLVDGARDLGRGPLGTFALADPAVSRLHARVTCVAERWRVEDCGSRNGTWLDGVALAGAARDARPGAIVRIGETVIVLAEHDDRAVVAHRSRCAAISAAGGDADLRASFLERALLATRRPGASWATLVRRARAHADGGPVTAASWIERRPHQAD